ncbi:MAG: carbohydrate ABC transporter permease [Spirochaetia bacterium]
MAVVGKEGPSRILFIVFNYTFLAMLTVISIIPIINLFSISISASTAVAANEVAIIPVGLNLAAYEHVAGNQMFFRAFLNSVIVVVLGVSTSMAITVLAAYPLSRNDREFKGRKIYVWYFIVTILFGGGMLPLFMVVKYTGLINTYWSLVLPSAVPVFNILMLMHFYRGIPKEVEESAFIDGAGYVRTMWSIMLPMAKPAIATLILFNFIAHWNEFFKPLIYLNDKSKYPLQAYLHTILTQPDLENRTIEEVKKFSRMDQRSINAAQIFVSMVPVMFVYPFLQKYFAKGIVLGSVKG